MFFLPFLHLFAPMFRGKERSSCKMSINNRAAEKCHCAPPLPLDLYILIRYEGLQFEEIRWLFHGNILPLQA